MAAPALDPTIVFGEAPERVRSDDVPSGTDADALAPYGWCVREVPEPDGRLLPRVVALTWEELLNPREGEQVVQDNEHFRIVAPLADVLRRWLERRPGFGVFSDFLIRWGIDGLRDVGPDVTVVEGLRRAPREISGSLDVRGEGASVRLVIEVISPAYSGQRRKDTEANPPLFAAAGVDELLLVDPGERGSRQPLGLAMWRLDAAGEYRQVAPDADGWLRSRSVALRFGSDDARRRVLVEDVATGERLWSAADLEERAADAEDEVARLREELARLRGAGERQSPAD